MISKGNRRAAQSDTGRFRQRWSYQPSAMALQKSLPCESSLWCKSLLRQTSERRLDAGKPSAATRSKGTRSRPRWPDQKAPTSKLVMFERKAALHDQTLERAARASGIVLFVWGIHAGSLWVLILSPASRSNGRIRVTAQLELSESK